MNLLKKGSDYNGVKFVVETDEEEVPMDHNTDFIAGPVDDPIAPLEDVKEPKIVKRTEKLIT